MSNSSELPVSHRTACAAPVRKGAWVSHLVLAEATWVLASAYGLGHAQLVIAIEMLLNHAELTVQDADVVAAALEQ